MITVTDEMRDAGYAELGFPPKGPSLALESIYRDYGPLIGNKLLVLVAEALHRVATMDETELRNFLPWLLYNDGELAGIGSAELAAIQGALVRNLPKHEHPLERAVVIGSVNPQPMAMTKGDLDVIRRCASSISICPAR